MGATSTLERLGRYQITQVLGQGAMGVVYAAHDPLLNRQVAIKTILRANLLDADLATDASTRFVREAQAVARLTHPHIVTVFDFGEEGDVAYIVMEFIHGRDLKSRLDEGNFFELAEAIRIMSELLDALDYAHRHGVVHRDIKPANVMLDAAGRIKLTDFGVARLADSNADRTMAGTMVGTPSYMSPEQIQGLPVGSRTDLFAAGIILYQLLTRKRPFPGPGQWTIQKQIVSDNPVPPSYYNVRLGSVFDPIVERALAKDPAKRYASAADFAADLKRAMTGNAFADSQDSAPVSTAPPSEDTLIESTLRLEPDAETTQAMRAPDPVEMESVETTILPDQTQPSRQTQDQTGKTATNRVRLGAVVVVIAVIATISLALSLRPMPQTSALDEAPKPSAPTPPVTTNPTQSTSTPAAKPSAAPSAPTTQPEMPARPVISAPTTESSPGTMKSESQPRARTALTKAPASGRCDDLLQRFQLGDALSPDDLAILQKECKK